MLANRGARGGPRGALAPTLLDLLPGVLERHRAIEHRMPRRRLGIDAEVAEPLELEALPRGLAETRLEPRPLDRWSESGLSSDKVLVAGVRSSTWNSRS